MPRIFFILLLSIFITPSWFTSTGAYWLDPPKPEPFTMHGAREIAPPSARKGIFTVQDNFNLFTRQDGSTPILLPHSDYFVGADIIDANIPIFGLFSHPATPAGDPIANLIYADVKLKKLLDDYTTLQQKAKRLLNNQYSAIPTGKIKTTEIVVPINQELVQLSARLATINTAGITSPAVAPSEQRHSAAIRGSSKPVISLRQMTSRQRRNQGQTSIATMNTLTRTNKSYTGSSINGINGVNHTSSGAATPAAKEAQDNSYSYSGKMTIPWFIDLPNKIFQYFISNKFEALFISFFVLLFISVIFGSRV